MSKGDVVSGLESVDPGAFLTLRPTSGREWVINNIFFNSSSELYWSDGELDLLCDCYLGFGRWSWEVVHLRHSFFLKIKNVSDSSSLIGYSGVVLK